MDGERLAEIIERECVWTEDADGCWSCSVCDIAWCFPEDGPKENTLRYCPNCGTRVTSIKPYEDDFDDEKDTDG